MVNQKNWEEPAMKAKSFAISKRAVFVAWKKVRANKGAAGVDEVSIAGFEEKLENNLYKLWNRMVSGAYFPPPVRRVMIPKADGGERPLGIPTVGDRVAQMVAKACLEPLVEPMFHPDSHAYRAGKSALDAVGQTRQRCWRYDWVVDLDIKGFFDNIDHALMLHAVRKHTDCKWLLLYIERWLKAPVVDERGKEHPRDCGTPQGGVISPLLANLFLHYVFDAWMAEHYPAIPFERYADDVVVHCKSEAQALRNAWADASWKRIPKRRKSSIARMTTGRAAITPSPLTFWATRFVPEGQRTGRVSALWAFFRAYQPKRSSALARKSVAGGYTLRATKVSKRLHASATRKSEAGLPTTVPTTNRRYTPY
jgi:group II intron reverse transcriptase/maturase